MSVPNQRIIYIRRNTENAKRNYFKIGHEPLNKASADLSGNAFKLYIYLANNCDKYRLELSSKHFVMWSNTSDSTYDRVFKELKDKGYLIQSKDKKNIYVFIEESTTYYERHKEDIFVFNDEAEAEELYKSLGLN